MLPDRRALVPPAPRCRRRSGCPSPGEPGCAVTVDPVAEGELGYAAGPEALAPNLRGSESHMRRLTFSCRPADDRRSGLGRGAGLALRPVSGCGARQPWTGLRLQVDTDGVGRDPPRPSAASPAPQPAGSTRTGQPVLERVHRDDGVGRGDGDLSWPRAPPSILSVSGSPVTGIRTLALTPTAGCGPGLGWASPDRTPRRPSR
jgi:hypothetical protein